MLEYILWPLYKTSTIQLFLLVFLDSKMFYKIFLLVCLSDTNGYNIKERVTISLNKETVLKLANNIIQELKQHSLGDFQARASQLIYNIFNILKTTDDGNINNENKYFTEKVPHIHNNEFPKSLELHNLAKDFINILMKFENKSLEQAWNCRPDIKAFTNNDLLGKLNDKNHFLQHLKTAGDMYKSAIDLCETQQFKRYERTIPNHLIVTDLITMADSYNIKILSNGGKPFDVYYSGHIIDGSLTVADLVGSAEDKNEFLKRVNVFSSHSFRNALNSISYHLYGIPVPDHLNTEWVIATAKYFNVVIVSNKGKEFKMDWRSTPDSFIGYPPGNNGGIDFVSRICLRTKFDESK